MSMTFQAIYTMAMGQTHHDPDTETALLTKVKTWVNKRYHQAWSKLLQMDPTFGRTTSILTTTDDYNTGTVEVDGTTTVTGTSTVWTSGMVGRKFKLDSFSEVYEISAYVSATEITLNKACNADADDGLAYMIYQDEVSLPSDCAEVVSLGIYRSYRPLVRIGIRELQEKQLDNPVSINSVDTLDPEYFTLLDQSTILVYPAPSRVVLLELYYIKNFTELSQTSDTPLIPADFHDALVTGTIADIYKFEDDTRQNTEEMEFKQRLNDLGWYVARRTDKMKIKHKAYRT